MPLSEKQLHSIQHSTQRMNFWCGSVRSGKTYSSIMRFNDFLMNGPRGDVMVIGVSRESIQRNVLNEMYRFLGEEPPTPKRNQDKIYGRNVYFVGASDESSVRRIQGATLAAAYCDEIACLPEVFVKMLQSRLSVPGAKMFGTCNPEGPSHWFKKKYIDKQDDLDLICFNFTLDDNPSLDDEYKKQLKKEYTGAWYNRLILGQWAVAQGLIYDAVDEDNFFDDDNYANPNYYIAGVDYGINNPTVCVLIACNPHKWPQLRVIDEYYFKSGDHARAKTDAELADDLQKFLANKPVQSIYVDPSAASLKLELSNRDMPVMDALNDVLPGVQIVHKFISGKNLLFARKCKNLYDEIMTYSWDSKAADKGVDKPLKVSDHVCFVSGTMIKTEEGEKEVENVKVGDRVLTRSGYQDVIGNIVTLVESDEIVEVQIGEITLKGTKNHPIYANDKWVALNSLSGYNKVCTIKGEMLCQSRKLIKSNIMELTTEDIQNQKMTPIETISDAIYQVMRRVEDIFTVMCGWMLTGQFQRVDIYTIPITINQITELRTLNVSQSKSMLQDTQKTSKETKYTSTKYDPLQRNGTLLKRVENGIVCMGPRSQKTCKKSVLNVINAVKSFILNPMGQLDSVITIASQSIEEKWVMITKNESVKIAKENSLLINTINKDFALENVDTNNKEKIKVYNLKVSNHPEYFANGILVSNCDALRYCVYSHFPDGLFTTEMDDMTHAQLMKHIYGEQSNPIFSPTTSYY